MKIQLSPKKLIKDALCVWNEHGPEVDIVMDLKNLTFAPGSIEVIFTFHVLDHLFSDEVPVALDNWKKCLKKDGELFLVVDDFEYICRAVVGGDIPVEMFNERHAHAVQFSPESLIKCISSAGFPTDKAIVWYESEIDLFKKKHYELLIVAKKHE